VITSDCQWPRCPATPDYAMYHSIIEGAVADVGVDQGQ
jgi:hypothetical protein